MSAASFWSRKGWSPMLLERLPYRERVAAEVASLEPGSVLEFGCGAGANLAAVRDLVPDARLVGYDINESYVAKGRAALGLDLRIGGVGALADERVDVAFTVSVLDHIEEPDGVLDALLRVAPVLVLLEPWTGVEGLIERDVDGRPATRHSYSWNYPVRLRDKGARVRTRLMPIGQKRLQPFYRLHIVRREP